MVQGADVNDIPTVYNTTGFKPYELIVTGTYIDKNIVPGFQYKVRKNSTKEYLFHGQGLTLESIGLGYGKRLTFSGNNLNNNKNYFWSDSHPQGFGLTFQTVTPNSVFRIIDLTSNNDIGRIIVNNPARSEDIEIATDVKDSGLVEKIANVHFSGDAVLSIASNKQKAFYEDIDVHGTAVIQRADKGSKAIIKEIKLDNFIVDNCLLVPEE
uniref:Uncharacterized protein n=1 Tax=Parasteatoda tepidariorum TaxID=114398 RepID=A0A2L2Y4G2_PARTP